MYIKDLEDKIKEAETVYEIVKYMDEFVGVNAFEYITDLIQEVIYIRYSKPVSYIDNLMLQSDFYYDMVSVFERTSYYLFRVKLYKLKLKDKLDRVREITDKEYRLSRNIRSYSQAAIKSSFERNFISEQLLSVEEQMQKEIELVKQKYESQIEDLKDRIQEIDQDHHEVAERMFRIPESELLELEQLKEDLGL